MKKLLALLLAMMMVFCLCACGNGADKDDRDDDKDTPKSSAQNKDEDTLTAASLEGKWEMTMDMSALLASGAMGTEDMPEILAMMDLDEMDLKVEMDVTFANGKLTFDPNGWANFYQDMIDAMMDWFEEGDNIYEFMAQASGDMTAEQYKAALESQGMTKDALIDAIKSEMPDADDALDDLDDELKEVYYKLDGDKLYTWSENEQKSEDDCFVFTYKKGVITVVKVLSDGETTNLTPGVFVFEKK